jgi:hypothetical protein
MQGPSLGQHLVVAASLALALSASPLAVAQGAPGSSRGVEYVTGGITQDEADALRQQAASFPLEIQFARRMDVGNAFAADVQVRVLDANGRSVIDIPAAQPILLANVPAGRYTIEATFDGQTKRQTVNVGRGRTQTTFLW